MNGDVSNNEPDKTSNNQFDTTVSAVVVLNMLVKTPVWLAMKDIVMRKPRREVNCKNIRYYYILQHLFSRPLNNDSAC